MHVVMDFDGTVYEPSQALKLAVVPFLRQVLIEHCGTQGESFDILFGRLVAKHNTTSLFMLIQLELDWTPEIILESAYVPGLLACKEEVTLRPGVYDFLMSNGCVTILTNAPTVWVAYLSKKLGVSDFIGNIYGLRSDFLLQKPDIKAFSQIEVPEVVFIDDSYRNCEVANSLGWKSFWFPEAEGAIQGIGVDTDITRINTLYDVTHKETG